MPKIFEILKPTIFPDDKIISGVTKRNTAIFGEKGFSISKGNVLSGQQVRTNREYLAHHLNIPYDNLIFQKQVHQSTIQIISEKTISDLESDGMITNKTGIVLNVIIADCCAVLMYDPVNNVVAALHSGWRGTKLNIVSKGIKLLESKFNTLAKNLLVYLSPCASGKNYEVGYDVAQYFPETAIRISSDKYLFDNQKQIILQLKQKGILGNNIETSDICTIENKDYHSYRRDKDISGRMSAFIGIKR